MSQHCTIQYCKQSIHQAIQSTDTALLRAVHSNKHVLIGAYKLFIASCNKQHINSFSQSENKINLFMKFLWFSDFLIFRSFILDLSEWKRLNAPICVLSYVEKIPCIGQHSRAGRMHGSRSCHLSNSFLGYRQSKWYVCVVLAEKNCKFSKPSVYEIVQCFENSVC